MTTPEFTLLENGLRKPLLETIQKYGKQKYTLWTVWTYMKWRSNDDIFSLPENLVREDLGIDLNVLRAARAILIKEGWLEKDVLRDTGGEYLTRTWLVTAPPSVYHSMGMQPPRVFTTEGKSPYSGSSSCSGSGSGSSSLSLSPSRTPSDSYKSGKGVRESNEKIEDKSKHENLEPEPTPMGVHGQKINGRAKKERYALNGTPWPEGFDSWPRNADRLEWLDAHGCNHSSKQDRMVEPASQKIVETGEWDGKPTATANPLLNPPGFAAPPTPRPDPYADDPIRCRNGCSSRSYPVYKHKLCRSCYEDESQRPTSIETTAPLDNWDE
jgi:hypothetical protein